MSKWTDVRNNIVDALHVDDVTEDVKQHVTSTILSEVVPVAENAVDDGIVLPLVMQGGIYIIKLVLSKTVAQTAPGNDRQTA